VFTASSIYIYIYNISLYSVFSGYYGALFVISFVIFVLFRFRVSLLAVNHLLIQ
jgi:hypothetical protein